MKIHIVQKGDTLWKIAKKYGVNFEELKKMNTQLSNPDMIMPGMKIKVPGSGGSIKKEAPIGGVPETKVSMGAKKEMPIKEMPIQAPPKEVPAKQYAPKMPKPIVSEIDINNYYMLNMANLSAQQPAPKEVPKQLPKELPKQMPKELPKQMPQEPLKQLPQELPKQMPQEPLKPLPKELPKQMPQELLKQPPQLPPKPVNILPPVKPIAQESPESIESESFVYTHQGGVNQPMLPYYPQSFYPVSPVMPGTGLPGGYPQAYGYPQVQGAAMPMYQAPAAPMYQMPHHGLAGVESDESSSSMPMHHMPYTSPAYSGAQMPAPLMGAAQMPAHVMGAEQAAPQMPLQPTYTAPIMQQAFEYPEVACPPYPAQMYPVSPVMPGSGFCEPMPYVYPQMCEPYGYPQMAPMPQVQGVMEEAQMPLMPTEAQMPIMPAQSQMPMMPAQSQMPMMPAQSQMPMMPVQSQMPMMPTQAQMPMMPVQAAKEDCGCGGPQMVQGAYNPGYGTYEMGAAPMYGAPYGQQMGYPMTGQMNPYMNPYGYGPMGGQAFGMPRSFEESSEYED
ncbi:SafA/ExsA family spore coat assembly protein [Bacillus sp. S/N-304-OC-R1]|uniref:SafA/ExsA family spore coat assembly protein n=1 Tax=Bacillus sp. S/N-304-OC-R1 TaxID=2758034 RepID=UPI001C8ED2E8|nr:SafA/ExsA family spore coat assembly protein [Bacillus sp. S/N-304-OC-R1]